MVGGAAARKGLAMERSTAPLFTPPMEPVRGEKTYAFEACLMQRAGCILGEPCTNSAEVTHTTARRSSALQHVRVPRCIQLLAQRCRLFKFIKSNYATTTHFPKYSRSPFIETVSTFKVKTKNSCNGTHCNRTASSWTHACSSSVACAAGP